MIRRTRRISTKLFIVTSLFLIGFLTLLTVVQSQYFETYYTYKKTNLLREGVEALRLEGAGLASDPEEAANKLAESFPRFENERTAKVAFGQVRDGFLIIVPEDRRLVLHRIGDEFAGAGTRNPVAKEYQLLHALDKWRNDPGMVQRVSEARETVSFAADISGYGILAAVTAFPGTEYVILAVAPTQPVGEAAAILKDFFAYFLLLAVAVTLLLTYLFSRMITRPLVKLNRDAEKMERLDFSAIGAEVAATDEIGSLGRTLHSLSMRLDRTLRELEDANDKLKADIETERKLEQRRQQFAASVSHELKTPISLIAGYAEGLKDGIVQGERRNEYLNVIIEETVRMESIVKDMLDLSQIRSGKYELKPEAFRLDRLLSSIIDKMAVELHKKAIHCELAFGHSAAEASVLGDPFRIAQVITNLLSNAVRHTPPCGRIRVTMTGAEEGCGMRVEIFNEGEWIPHDELDYIWDTFYTVEKSHNRQWGGTGIGLAIVRNILLVHGSPHGVRNVEGGVLFHFSLPLANGEKQDGSGL